jgi:dehydrogenase/reductase SDR family member 1
MPKISTLLLLWNALTSIFICSTLNHVQLRNRPRRFIPLSGEQQQQQSGQLLQYYDRRQACTDTINRMIGKSKQQSKLQLRMQSQQTSTSQTIEALEPQQSSLKNTTITPNQNGHKRLHNVVCLVTGASRGIGKGIALQLGSHGAIVYVTGTTISNTTLTLSSSESIEQTAYEIQQLGGIGKPLLCDHRNDTEVQRVLQIIEHEYGYLDLLVNNAFRFPTMTNTTSDTNRDDNEESSDTTMELFLRQKFWQQGAMAWDTIHTVGLRSHYITTCHAMKLLLQSRSRPNRTTAIPRPLIAMISSFGGLTYSFNVAYGVGKAGVDRMVKDMVYELESEDICVVSLWPGVVNTERTQRMVRSGDWDKYVQLSLDQAETPQFTGNAIVALATDADNLQKSGTVQVVAELATEYGFTDVDGKTVPPSIRSLRFLLYNYVIQKSPLLRNRIPSTWIPDIRIPFWIMAQGRPPSTDESNKASLES